MKNSRIGLAAIAIGVMLALAAALQVTDWERQILALSNAQDAASERVAALHNLAGALVDAETGQRGYLLTGHEEYLQPYENGRRDLETAASKLSELVADDPAAKARLDDLLTIAREREDELGRTVALRRAGDTAAALAIVNGGDGKRLMDRFRATATAQLEQLSSARTAITAAKAGKFDWAVGLGSVAAVLMLGVFAIALMWLLASLRRVGAVERARQNEAMYDALTMLPNRRYLAEWMRMTIAAARRNRQRVVLLYFDLNGFNALNDQLGREAADRVLQVMALRLRGGVRMEDFVARIGGDEFVAVLPDTPGEPELVALTARLGRDLAKAPIAELADGDVLASISHAAYPDDGDDLDTLLAAADRGMTAAKERHRTAAPPPGMAGVPRRAAAG